MQIWDEFKKASSRAGTSNVAASKPTEVDLPPLQNIGLTPGFTPDYKGLILSDPAYLAWKNSANLDVSTAAAQRKAALSALAMQYGGLGTGFQDTFGDLTPDTLALAKGNQYSDVARLQRNYEQGVQGVKRDLAARGGLQSGELGYGLDQQNLARATSEYDLSQQFGNAAQTAINNYLAAEGGARRGEVSALQNAEANVYNNPLNRPAAGTRATLDPEWRKYGIPVYIGPDGRRYRIDNDGNPVLFDLPGSSAEQPPAAAAPYEAPGKYNPGTGTIGIYGPPAPGWNGPAVPPYEAPGKYNPGTGTIGVYGPPAPGWQGTSNDAYELMRKAVLAMATRGY